jgi:hypothetical protein
VRDNDKLILDVEGADFPNLEAAQFDIKSAARQLLAEQIRRDGVLNSNQQFEICDEAGHLLVAVPFTSTIKLQ